MTLGATPVLVYPVLHVHTMALPEDSCEQIEFASHPPFFTRQLSTRGKIVEVSKLQEGSKRGSTLIVHTCARNYAASIGVGETSLAATADGVRVSLVRTRCIKITTTIVYLTRISAHDV